jgi:hypothetical protein
LVPIEKDSDEPKEQSEPNPDKEPVIVQPDTDEMNMMGEEPEDMDD